MAFLYTSLRRIVKCELFIEYELLPQSCACCTKGNVGPLCAVCADGFTRVRGKCFECDTGIQVALLIVGISVGLVIFFLVTRFLKKAGKAVGTAETLLGL